MNSILDYQKQIPNRRRERQRIGLLGRIGGSCRGKKMAENRRRHVRYRERMVGSCCRKEIPENRSGKEEAEDRRSQVRYGERESYSCVEVQCRESYSCKVWFYIFFCFLICCPVSCKGKVFVWLWFYFFFVLLFGNCFFFFLMMCWRGKLWKLQKLRFYIYIYRYIDYILVSLGGKQ